MDDRLDTDYAWRRSTIGGRVLRGEDVRFEDEMCFLWDSGH